MTPLLNEEKCDKKLKEAIASTAPCGSQALKKSRTKLVPLNKKIKQTTTDIIKAITWFWVVEDIHDPMARKPPDIKRLPKYPERIAPLSGEPK